MNRRTTAAVLVLAAICIAPMATAAESKSNLNAVSQETPLRDTLARIFARTLDEAVQTRDGMLVMEPMFPHVMVVAIDHKGEIKSGCVDNEHSAHRVLAHGARKIERGDTARTTTTTTTTTTNTVKEY